MGTVTSGDWVLVPMHPTDGMLREGSKWDTGMDSYPYCPGTGKVWAAMLAAAPQPPAEAQGGWDLGEVACLACGDPIMPMGQVCHACSHPVSAPPSASVGVEEVWLRPIVTQGDYVAKWGFCNPEEPGATRFTPRAQQPAAVDEAMAERAARAWCAGTDTPFDQLPDAGKARCLEDMRVVLTAALAAQQGGAE